MNECVNGCGTELSGRRKTYCSDRCRKQHSRKSDKPEQKSDNVRVTAEVGQVIDVHNIPRTPAAQADFELLESWRNGEGTVYQQRLGQLAYNYRPDYTKEKYYEPGSCKMCGCELPLPLTYCHPCVDAKYEAIASSSVA